MAYRLGRFLIGLRIVGASLATLLWPLWVLVPGALMLYMAYRNKPAQIGWAIPGALIGGTGAILFMLNLTGRWEAWAYMWALYPSFVGAALYTVGEENGDDEMMTGGRHAFRSGMWTFVVFGLFFELVIFNSLFGNALLPVALLVAGAYLVYAKRLPWTSGKDGRKSKRRLTDEKDKPPASARTCAAAWTRLSTAQTTPPPSKRTLSPGQGTVP